MLLYYSQDRAAVKKERRAAFYGLVKNTFTSLTDNDIPCGDCHGIRPPVSITGDVGGNLEDINDISDFANNNGSVSSFFQRTGLSSSLDDNVIEAMEAIDESPILETMIAEGVDGVGELGAGDKVVAALAGLLIMKVILDLLAGNVKVSEKDDE
jgi:hypothetical protein